MNNGGDAADQIVRYSLEGTEVALKLTGSAAKNFAVFAAAVLKDQKKTRGKTNLTRLLTAGKPLKFFMIPEDRAKDFANEAKARGLLYVPVKNKKQPGKIELAVWAEDAAKVNRVMENMGIDYLKADTGAKADIEMAEQSEQALPLEIGASETEMIQTADGIVPIEIGEQEDLFSVGFTQAEAPLAVPVPSNPSEPSSDLQSSSPPSADDIRAEGGKPSVKQEIGEIKEQLKEKEPAARENQPQRQHPPRRKKKNRQKKGR